MQKIFSEGIILIYLVYLVLALLVIGFSVKAANYVELIDKKTNISGAFIGGVILAAITSLPEFFTSVSAALILGNSELVLGNILGSNIFNLAVMAIVIVAFIDGFVKSKISLNHNLTLIFVLISSLILFFPVYFKNDISILNFSVVSLIIIVFYIISLKFMAGDGNEDSSPDEKDNCKLSLRQISIRFVLVSIGLVVSSIFITYVTDMISIKLDLASSLSGALFLGIATSLPEVTSVIALARKMKFDLAVGNIIGSNMFNLLIVSIVDVLYVGKSMYRTDQMQTRLLLSFGVISTIFILTVLILKKLNFKNKFIYLVLGFLTIITYLVYLILSL